MGVIAVFLAIAAVCAGLALLAKRSSEQRSRAVAGWPTAQALVTSADLMENPGSWYRYLPSITYRYEAQGQIYENDRIRFGGMLAFTNQQKAQDFMQRYPVQAQVTAYYDPKRPNVSLLDPTPYSVAYIALLLVAVTVGAMGLLAGAAVMIH